MQRDGRVPAAPAVKASSVQLCPGLSRSVCRLGVRIGAESPNDGWFSFTAYIRFSLLVLKLGVHAPWEYS